MISQLQIESGFVIGQILEVIRFPPRNRRVNLVKGCNGLISVILFFSRLSASSLLNDCNGLISLIRLLLRSSFVRLESS